MLVLDIILLDQDIEFWNGMMSDYSELVKKIPQVLIQRIRGGIPYNLRVCKDMNCIFLNFASLKYG